MRVPVRAIASRGHRLAFLGVAIFTLLLTSPIVVTPASGTSSRTLQPIGAIPWKDSAQWVVDARNRRVVVIRPAGTRAILELYDAERLGVGDDAGLLKQLVLLEFGFGARPSYAWNPSSGMLHLVVYPRTFDRAVPGVLGLNPEVVADNLRALLLPIQVTTTGFVRGEPRDLGVFPPGWLVVGADYVRAAAGDGGDRIYAIAQPGGSVNAHGVLLAEIDPVSGRSRWQRPVHVQLCAGAISTRLPATVARSRDAAGRVSVYIGCARVGTPAAVAAIDVTEPSAPRVRTYPIAGSYGAGESLHDPRGHRFLMVSSGGVRSQSIWIFDDQRRVFLGNQAADAEILSVGLDEDRGIVYVTQPGELLVGSVRGLDLGQLERFPAPDVPAATSSAPIVPVPFAKTLIVPGHGGHLVYRDPTFGSDDLERTPRSGDDELVNLGESDVFSGGAQAFGVRVHQLGGIESTLQNLVPKNADYWYGSPAQVGLGQPGGLEDGDRTFSFARVMEARLSQDTVTAEAVSRHADDGITDADVERVSGGPWSTPAAQCADLGSTPQQSGGNDIAADASCDRANAKVSAGAIHRSASNGMFAIGQTTTDTAAFRDPKSGIVAEAYAEARKVMLGDVHIGRIWTRVQVSAAGARGSARSVIDRGFENVSSEGFSCETACDPAEVLTAIDGALRGFAITVQMPEADQEATTDGTRAWVQRDPWEHRQDVTLHELSGRQAEVPALRLVVVRDGTDRARTIVDIAAAKVDVALLPPTGARGGINTPSDGFAISVPPLPDSAPRAEIPDLESPGAGSSPEAIRRFVQIIGHGWRWLIGGPPGATLVSASMFVMFGLPALLASRRRHLVRVIGTEGG